MATLTGSGHLSYTASRDTIRFTNQAPVDHLAAAATGW